MPNMSLIFSMSIIGISKLAFPDLNACPTVPDPNSVAASFVPMLTPGMTFKIDLPVSTMERFPTVPP